MNSKKLLGYLELQFEVLADPKLKGKDLTEELNRAEGMCQLADTALKAKQQQLTALKLMQHQGYADTHIYAVLGIEAPTATAKIHLHD